MDHWLEVVTCTLISTAPSLSSPMTCCFRRPGLCFRATGFSFFFHATDLQMNFNSQFMVRNFWAHVPSTVLCSRLAFLPPRKPAPGVSYLGIFYTFLNLGMEYRGVGQGIQFTFATWGPIYTLEVFSERPGDWLGVGRENKSLIFHYRI